MLRKATVGIALVAALLLAGCGDDDTSAGSATATVASGTATAGSATATTAGKSAGTTTSATKSSGTSKSKLPAATKASPGTKKNAGTTSGSTSSSGSNSSPARKSSTTKKPATGAAGGSGGGGDSGGNDADSVGTSNSRDDRLVVVSVVRRYQKAFIDFDGREACSLLTSAGKKIMTEGARSESCPSAVLRVLDQASPADLKLLETTRDGLTTKDVTIRDGKATVDIGKGERLRLVVVDGRWRIADPSP